MKQDADHTSEYGTKGMSRIMDKRYASKNGQESLEKWTEVMPRKMDEVLYIESVHALKTGRN